MLNDITLNGFYNYDPSILTDLDLPEGIDEEELRFTILDNAGMMVPYHQVLPQLGLSIHMWFRQNKDNFARIIAVMNKEYNPIENYDRYEDRTEGRTSEHSEDKTAKTVGSMNGSDITNMSNSQTGSANSTTTTNTGSDSTDQRAADNSETFRNTNKTIGTANSSGTNGTYTNGTNTGNTNVNKLENTTEDVTEGLKHESNENITESLHVHGNIGVTTNQQMVQAELDLRRYNIYEDICNRFVDKFLLGVYD